MPEIAPTSDQPSHRSYPEAARELLQDTLLNSVGELLAKRNWSEISMATIAKQAGVSRQTLYNEFGSRDAFAQRYVLRETTRFIDLIESAIAKHNDSPRAAVKAAFSVFLRSARENPMVRAIVIREPGADDLFALFTTRGGPVIELATERISNAILQQWPGSDKHAVQVASESMVRLGISHAGLPTGSEEHAAETVAALIGPYGDQFVRP